MTAREYLRVTREPRHSLVFALPLLLLYEGLAALMSGSAYAGVRNGADVLLKTLFVTLGGRTGLTLFGIGILGAGAWFVLRDVRRRGAVRPRLFLPMLGESLVYAALLGSVVATLTTMLLHPQLAMQSGIQQLGIGQQLVVSLGAGLYEELLFRVLLVGALTGLALKLGWRRGWAVFSGILGSALIFSAFHYIGPLGDQLTLSSFTFRAIAGLMLSGLYVARGFGIAAWSHALYDVGITLLS